MEIKQVATILNTINREMTGETAIVNEDLSNIVDIGKQLTADMTADEITKYMENYTKKIIDKVGRTIIVDRAYKSTAPNIIRDSWEYGGIMEKIRVTVGDLEDDTTWGLTAGDTPEQFKYTPADLSAKYYDKYDTFMTQISIPEKTLRSAFNSAQDMNRLISAIENRVATKMAYSTDNLIRRTVNNMILEVAKTPNSARFVKLLTLYNQGRADTLPASMALKTPDFLRFAIGEINKYRRLIQELSTAYGGDGYVNFTPIENQKLIMQADFVESARVNMESDTFNRELVQINGDYDIVSYWQSPNNPQKIQGTPASGSSAVVSPPEILGVLFDEDACAVELEDNQVTSNYAANGRFYNYFHYANARYMNDMSENVVIFVLI